MSMNWLTIAVAAYAAVVASAALALEVRRWFESGARLKISCMPNAKTINVPGTEGAAFLIASVANRGNAPTTITHFALYEYKNWFDRLRSKPAWTAVIVNPAPPGALVGLPCVLQPGEVWTGIEVDPIHETAWRLC